MTKETLNDAFGDCHRQRSTPCKIATSYIETDRAEFYIFDDAENVKRPVTILEEKGDSQLTIINSHGFHIHIVKTDNCLFSSADGHKRCDCILFNETRIYLVEIKNSGKSTRSAARDKAILQLGDTIDLLKNNGIIPTIQQIFAVICFKLIDKHQVTNTTNSTRRILFFEKYNIDLLEGNVILFTP